MATYVKRSGAWRAQVTKRGQRHSRTFDTKAAARMWAEQLEDDIVNGVTTANKTLGDAITQYVNEVAPSHAGHRWEVLRLEGFVSHFPELANMPIARLETEHLTQWKRARLDEVQPGTVRREMTLLTAVLEHARKELHWLKENPIKDVTKPKSPKSRYRRISDDEISRIIFALEYEGTGMAVSESQRVAIAFLLAIETGMRSGEMTSLTWSQVHARHVHLDKSKNGDERDVPLSRQARVLLDCLPRDGELVFNLTPERRDIVFRDARNRTGIEDLQFHDSRHEAITRLARRLELLDLARMIGHRDIRSLMIYYNPTPDEIATRLDAPPR